MHTVVINENRHAKNVEWLIVWQEHERAQFINLVNVVSRQDLYPSFLEHEVYSRILCLTISNYHTSLSGPLSISRLNAVENGSHKALVVHLRDHNRSGSCIKHAVDGVIFL